MAEHLLEGPIKKEFFVAHSFTTQYKDDLRRAVEDALCGHLDDFKPYYADKEIRKGHIFVDKIIPKIKSTEFGIYEITEQSPNVFLELGAAIALGRTYYILCRKGSKIPADLKGLDRIEYKSFLELTEQLKKKIAKSKEYSEGTEEHIEVDPEVISQSVDELGKNMLQYELEDEVLRAVNEVYPDYMDSKTLIQKLEKSPFLVIDERKLEIAVTELEELGYVKVRGQTFGNHIGMVKITAQGRKLI